LLGAIGESSLADQFQNILEMPVMFGIAAVTKNFEAAMPRRVVFSMRKLAPVFRLSSAWMSAVLSAPASISAPTSCLR